MPEIRASTLPATVIEEYREQLARSIDPYALGHDAVGADIARAADSPVPRQLDAGCIRSSYEAIAAAGEHAGSSESTAWRAGLRALREVCSTAEETDDRLVVRAVAAAADALRSPRRSERA